MLKAAAPINEAQNLNDEPLCPRCGSKRISQYGRYKGTIDYKCPDCHHSFLAYPRSIFARKFPPKNLRPEEMFECDVWDIRVFGLKPSRDESYILNFSSITPLWLKDAAKQWLKYRINTDIDAPSTIVSRLIFILHFSKFIKSHSPEIKPQSINRNLLTDFYTYLLQYHTVNEKMNEALGNLRHFIECCVKFAWIEVPQECLIFLEYVTKESKTIDRTIPDDITKQIEDNLEALPETVARMVKVIQETGMTSKELCSLKFDCLSRDTIGRWWIEVDKINRRKINTSITISKELVSAIQNQQQYIRDNLGSDFPYLFCETKKYTWFSKYTYQKPPQDITRTELKYFVPKTQQLHLETLRGYLNQLAHEKKIVDTLGRTFPFGIFYELRNSDKFEFMRTRFRQYTVQNHPSHNPSVTPVDTHIDDETMKRDLEKFWNGKVVNIKGEEIESLNPKLNTFEMQWFKKNMKSQRIHIGWCRLPLNLLCLLQGDHCSNCQHLATSKEFLLVLKEKLKNTEKLIKQAEINGCQRQLETNKVIAENLRKIISSLEGTEH